jgi:Flp pilus assembly protein TadB
VTTVLGWLAGCALLIYIVPAALSVSVLLFGFYFWNKQEKQERQERKRMNKNYLTAEEMVALESTESEEEWNAVCDAVKGARYGQYPYDWYDKVLRSGLAARKQEDWEN